MRKPQNLFLILASAFLLVSVLIFASSARTYAAEKEKDVSELSGQNGYFVVRQIDGKIGIFGGTDEQPITTIDVDVAELPEEDRNLLESGLIAESYSELVSIIEDYQS
ncbi:MAG: BofC C-terminal domain-containing protein [Oscillospiraceae bacterium]|jgi:hypothetical protein|nr:BofC C-terminal domain-containing protein [Oscillospiraceae bacterium]